ncbi:MAG TPA: type VI secretion protein IcmF/TssM N-terminal domain-containing protein, partial [Chthoniobacteraceae bacterium]
GAGKTEAIRHSEVGFPPGMQDEFQGVGGTINMNWWFTNHAVMLDTAGRLMFEEVKPGETSEWREFLQLLRRNRPDCPINGLLLVIPADSLIRDTTDSISSKAGKIAQQLDVIQRTLDVRFPVFVLITKCDLLSGFREFFEGLNDPHSQHQMIGWTNPEPRDAVFQPNRVVEFLQTVIDRVRKRRLGLLRDPVPEKDGAKRIDEVDALFSLPHSLSLIGPRLRSYLETIFVAGEWSAKPLFLRGIYFTSAMREGAALDQELAEALGVSLDDLPEGKAWERERAYFLRDMFMEKAFREKGLVTRATNTNQLLRRRRIYLWGTLSVALLALIGLSFFGFVSLKNSVGQQSQYWGPAKQGWDNGVWHPIVEKDAAGHYQYKGDQPAFPPSKESLIDYYGKIRELCEKNIDVGWIYLPMARFTRLEGDRKKAQRILLEGSVINPLVKDSRQLMTDPARDKPPADVSSALLREAEGVAALIGIESDALSHNRDVTTIPDNLVAPLLRYTTGQEKPADPGNFKELSNTIDWTYTKNPNGVWPPPWLPIGSTTLASNKPIDAGIQRMLKFVDESLKTQESGLADVRRIRDLLRAFRQKETEMNTTATSAEGRTTVYSKMSDAEKELGKTKVALD